MKEASASGQSSLFAEASLDHARTSARPARAPGSEEHAPVSGSKWRGSSLEYARRGASLRTSLLCVLEALTGFSLTWKKSATPHGRWWWVLGRSAHHTEGIASGSSGDWSTPNTMTGGQTSRGGDRKGEKLLGGQVRETWPTPCAQDDNKSPEAHMAMKRRMPGGPRNTITSLQVMTKALAWPTPTVQDSENTAGPSQFERNSLPLNALVAGLPDPASRSTSGKPRGSWSTPRSQDEYERRNWKTIKKVNEEGGDLTLPSQTMYQAQQRGSLNSRWVASLMGFPPDWCELDDATIAKLSKPTATRSCPTSPRQSSEEY